jgi:hypothetical protein
MKWRTALICLLTFPAFPIGFVVKTYLLSFMTGWNAARRLIGRLVSGDYE